VAASATAVAYQTSRLYLGDLVRSGMDGRRFASGIGVYPGGSCAISYLARSDRQTNTLWSQMWGEPVLGPLAESGIRLKALPLVATTWGDWRRTHPHTPRRR
jgi:hypothetical protein